MGVSANAARFLLHAKAQGVSFAKTATIGRMRMHLTPSMLLRILNDFGDPAGREDVTRLMTEQDSYSEPFFARLGATEVCSFDASDYESATAIHDFNLPIPDKFKNRFTAVYNGGSLEHVFNFPVAIQNCMEMLEVGGHFITHTMANNFMGHGFYQFSPELFYRVFSPENGFRMHRAVMCESRIGKPRWYEAADPQQVGERVELINGRQTYLLVHAERVADVPIFSKPPQQTDYSALWRQGVAPTYDSNGLRARIHKWAKSHNELFLRYSPGFLYDLALSTIVRGVPRRGFRRRQFVPLRNLRG